MFKEGNTPNRQEKAAPWALPSYDFRAHALPVRISSRAGILLLLLTALFAAAGCAPVISSQIRKEAAVEIPFREVLRDPQRYVGETFIWSGSIVEAKNVPEGTRLKVLQHPADRQGRPRDVDVSEGRFLALDRRYLDPSIYSPGREVTVAGRLAGKEVLPLGEIQYTYPLLDVEEIHLWPRRAERVYMHPSHPRSYWWWHSHGWGARWWY